jgi:hypothetical protein
MLIVVLLLVILAHLGLELHTSFNIVIVIS